MSDDAPAVLTRPARRGVMVRLSAQELERFSLSCRHAGISQQRALAGLVRMFVEQTETARQQNEAAAIPAAQ